MATDVSLLLTLQQTGSTFDYLDADEISLRNFLLKGDVTTLAVIAKRSVQDYPPPKQDRGKTLTRLGDPHSPPRN